MLVPVLRAAVQVEIEPVASRGPAFAEEGSALAEASSPGQERRRCDGRRADRHRRGAAPRGEGATHDAEEAIRWEWMDWEQGVFFFSLSMLSMLSMLSIFFMKEGWL